MYADEKNTHIQLTKLYPPTPKTTQNRTGPLAATARALPSTRATQLTLTHPAPLSSSAKKEGDGAGDGTQRSAAAAVVSLSSFGGGDRRRHRTSPPITPGQYYLVSVPAVAGGVGGEWHPFSVAVGGAQPEGPEGGEEEEEGEGPQAGPPMSFVVKDCGAWDGRGLAFGLVVFFFLSYDGRVSPPSRHIYLCFLSNQTQNQARARGPIGSTNSRQQRRRSPSLSRPSSPSSCKAPTARSPSPLSTPTPASFSWRAVWASPP